MIAGSSPVVAAFSTTPPTTPLLSSMSAASAAPSSSAQPDAGLTSSPVRQLPSYEQAQRLTTGSPPMYTTRETSDAVSAAPKPADASAPNKGNQSSMPQATNPSTPNLWLQSTEQIRSTIWAKLPSPSFSLWRPHREKGNGRSETKPWGAATCPTHRTAGSELWGARMQADERYNNGWGPAARA